MDILMKKKIRCPGQPNKAIKSKEIKSESYYINIVLTTQVYVYIH